MSFKTEQFANYTLITFSTDRIDSIVSPDVKSELVLLNKSNKTTIILDLTTVRYCDSSGLSALLIGYRLANESKGKFVICNLQSVVQKLITISQLDSILEITETLSDAVKLIQNN